jgi:hypothetical protein
VAGNVELGYVDQLFVHEFADTQVGEFAAVTGILAPRANATKPRFATIHMTPT